MTRDAVIKALRTAVDALNAAARTGTADTSGAAITGLLVVTGTPEEDGQPYPTRRATLEDVVAWLEAVVEPGGSSLDVVLVTLDWGVMRHASALRVPPQTASGSGTLSLEATLQAVGVSRSVSYGIEEATPEPTSVEVSPLSASLTATAYPPTVLVEAPSEELATDTEAVAVTVERGGSGLERQSPSTIGLERTLARAPVFAASSVRHGLQLELGLWVTTGSLYGQPFRVLEPRGPLTPRDALGFAHMIRRWADSGYPEDRRVRASEPEAIGWFGYSTTGGRQRQLLREAMGRLRATTFQSASRVEGGRSETLTWGLISNARTPRTGPEGRVSVTLSEEVAYLVRVGSVAYLDAPTFVALVAEDELAARLWVFLEAERLPWRWSLYSAAEGLPAAERDTPAIADLLRISSWERRRDVARRVAQAVQVIQRHDPRYRLGLERSPTGRGMWTLHGYGRAAGTPGRARVLPDAHTGTAGRARQVLRDAHSRSESAPTVVSLPSSITNEYTTTSRSRRGSGNAPSWDTDGAVLDAWRSRYPRPPTTRQLRVLAELVSRHDVAGIARALREAPAETDALASVLARDSESSRALRREEAALLQRDRARTDRHASEDGAVLEGLATEVASSSTAPAADNVAATGEAPAEEDAVAVAARRRAGAVAMLRAGLAGAVAERLRRDYAITDEELRG